VNDLSRRTLHCAQPGNYLYSYRFFSFQNSTLNPIGIK